MQTGGKGPCRRPQDGTFLELFQHALQAFPMGDANNLADVCKMALFRIISACFADIPYSK